MKSKPTDSTDGMELDYTQIKHDLYNFNLIHKDIPIEHRLHQFILNQQQFISTGLTLDRLKGFAQYPRYNQLLHMATHGLQPYTKDDFVPNRGRGDFKRTAQHHRLRHTIAHHVRKLQDKGLCVILPLSIIDGVPGVHLSALHVAYKAGDPKGRPCIDATHSGLNDGTNMDALTTYLGEFKLPQLRALARMLAVAETQDNGLVHKTDVSSAFNNMRLSPECALMQIFQLGDMAVIPLVAGFGWCAAPAYYNVIAGAIDWAHNGGITDDQLDHWAALQPLPSPGLRNTNKVARSITYVDDSCGQSSSLSADGDMHDLRTIISTLLGPAAYNKNKTEGPANIITIIGWQCDLRRYTIRPSYKGQAKLYYWVFRGLSPTTDMVSLHDLQSAVGTLRWYSAVVPMASTYELQQLLTATQRRASATRPLTHSHTRVHCRLTPAVQRELDWWRWLLTQNFTTPMLETPVWFLAKRQGTREQLCMYTDASSDTGGGYFIPEQSYGQFKWSAEEKLLYGKGDKTDINGLEFVTAICAIMANRDILRGKVVRLHVDNTSAVAWINKQRTSQRFGQTWIRLLLSVMLTHNILVDCVHIPGVLNTYADALSRFLQDKETQTLVHSLLNRPVLSAESRHSVWSASATPLLPKEYLQQLQTLEEQDSVRSHESATALAGPHHT
jgi:hypothetical protein